MSPSIKRLFVDIETAPNIGFFWGAGHDIDVPSHNIITERAIICIAWKWAGSEKVHSVQWDARKNDRAALKTFMRVLDQADEVVAHNGTRFDVPWLRTRALFHKLGPLSEVKLVDTLRIAWTRFKFNDNRLDYLARFLGIGAKLSTGFALWRSVVLLNDRKALASMVEYCRNDVALLEQVYLRLAPHSKPVTHAGVAAGKPAWACPHCGSTNVKKNKTRVTPSGTLQHVMVCKDCGSYYTLSNAAFKRYEKEKGTYV